MSNAITIELAAEDRERLDILNINLTELITRLMGGTPNASEVIRKATPTAEDHPVENPFREMPVETPVPFEEPVKEAPNPEYTLSDIQQKVVALSAAGKKAEVRDIVKAYAEKVSAIPADKFTEVMEKLNGLGV